MPRDLEEIAKDVLEGQQKHDAEQDHLEETIDDAVEGALEGAIAVGGALEELDKPVEPPVVTSPGDE